MKILNEGVLFLNKDLIFGRLKLSLAKIMYGIGEAEASPYELNTSRGTFMLMIT